MQCKMRNCEIGINTINVIPQDREYKTTVQNDSTVMTPTAFYFCNFPCGIKRERNRLNMKCNRISSNAVLVHF